MRWPATLVEWEWIFPELALLVILIWDLRRTRMSIRRDKEEAARRDAENR